MNNLNRLTQIKRGIFFSKYNWLLNIYIIQSNNYENVIWEEVQELIEKMLNDIETNCISEEFIYYRTGFIFVHYGNRGINLSIWHIGRWGETYEFFKRTWYCYGRDINKMETLDDAEPFLSQYEIFYLNEELIFISNIIKNISSDEEFREQYINKTNN